MVTATAASIKSLWTNVCKTATAVGLYDPIQRPGDDPIVVDGVMFVDRQQPGLRPEWKNGAGNLALSAAQEPIGADQRRRGHWREPRRCRVGRPRLLSDRRRAPDRAEPSERRPAVGCLDAHGARPVSMAGRPRRWWWAIWSSPASAEATMGFAALWPHIRQPPARRSGGCGPSPSPATPAQSRYMEGFCAGGRAAGRPGRPAAPTRRRCVYWAVGNPHPDTDGDQRLGSNLYTNSDLAIDAKTGKLLWYFQFTPHDLHDWDANEPIVLADTKWKGQERKLLLHANRNGFLYVLDRRQRQAAAGHADGGPDELGQRDRPAAGAPICCRRTKPSLQGRWPVPRCAAPPTGTPRPSTRPRGSTM